MPRVLLVAVIIILSFAFGTKAFADRESEHDKIVYLLNTVGSSDLVFIRNGAEHNGKEAKAHLQQKLDTVGFLIHTAEDFINYIGSASSITGTPYYVRLADGTQMKAGDWMRVVLVGMNEKKDSHN